MQILRSPTPQLKGPGPEAGSQWWSFIRENATGKAVSAEEFGSPVFLLDRFPGVHGFNANCA